LNLKIFNFKDIVLFLARILFYWLKNKALVNADNFISSNWLILNHADPKCIGGNGTVGGNLFISYGNYNAFLGLCVDILRKANLR